LLRLLDQRIDDVGLVAGGDLAADASVDPLAARLAAELGRDRGAPGRQLVEGRDREVAVERQRERARDGRGAHDEHVHRLGAAALERRALQHAEAMLLVDDGEPEAREAYPLLDER